MANVVTWIYPVTTFTITQPFSALHPGVDLGCPDLTPVFATAAGKVIFVGTWGSGGNTVAIDHNNGYISQYMHLTSSTVSVGTIVTQGQQIGLSGHSGKVTGPHVHFEINTGSGLTAMNYKYAIDPIGLINGVFDAEVLSKNLSATTYPPASLNNPDSNIVLVRGAKIEKNIFDRISTMTFNFSTTQVTELVIELTDPKYEILKSGVFEKGTPIKYMNHNLLVSVIETTNLGLEGLTIRCRPKFVAALRALQTPKNTGSNNISRSNWAISEFKLVGAPYIVDPNTISGSPLSRDNTPAPQNFDLSDIPSAWSTLQRMAGESRFLFYEHEGVMYFGDPIWIVNKLGTMTVNYGATDGSQTMGVPTFRTSVDTRDTSATILLPLSRINEAKLGRGLTLKDFPYFSGTYMITEVTYPLIGGGVLTVTVSTVRSPYPQTITDAPSSPFEGLTRQGVDRISSTSKSVSGIR